jgi:hypothetical protein
MSTPSTGAIEYKFVETSVVTDDSLERIVNEWVGQGWQLDGIHFVVATTSKRPVMAFLAFTRAKPDAA